MSDPEIQYRVSRLDFAQTLLRGMGTAMLLCVVVMGAAHYFLENAVGRELRVNPVFAVTIAMYPAFVFGWGIAYSRYFRFPRDQQVLLGGAAGSAAIVSILGGIMRLALGQTTLMEWLTALPGHLSGSFLAALLQIYLFVAILRYVFRIKLPF